MHVTEIIQILKVVSQVYTAGPLQEQPLSRCNHHACGEGKHKDFTKEAESVMYVYDDHYSDVTNNNDSNTRVRYNYYPWIKKSQKLWRR